MCLVRPFFFAKPSIFFCRLKGDRPAGKAALLAERKKIGDIPVGKAAVTSALRLNVQYIIYTVGPVRHGGDPDQRFAAERKERTALSEPAGDSSLSDAIGDRDISFQEYLLQLIIERDLENAEVYHRANITKQHFSKIMSNRHYHPKKIRSVPWLSPCIWIWRRRAPCWKRRGCFCPGAAGLTWPLNILFCIKWLTSSRIISFWMKIIWRCWEPGRGFHPFPCIPIMSRMKPGLSMSRSLWRRRISLPGWQNRWPGERTANTTVSVKMSMMLPKKPGARSGRIRKIRRCGVPLPGIMRARFPGNTPKTERITAIYSSPSIDQTGSNPEKGACKKIKKGVN